MDSEKNHIIYTAEDIQKYLSGKLEPAEMHAMEKAALDDAFLAEAMEGYSSMQEKDWENQLLSLKNNFSKGRQAKIIGLKTAVHYPLWKVAAAMLVICSGVGITYILTTKEPAENKSIAVVNTKQDSINGAVAESRSVDTDTIISSPIIKKSTTKASKQSITARGDKEALADSTFIYRPGETVDKKELKKDAGGGYADDELKRSNDLSSNNAAPPAQQNNIPENKTESRERAKKATAFDQFTKIEPAVTRKFTAQVVGPDGTPLPFANISIINENIGTYADAKGNFRLVSADSVLNIEIKSAGYVSRNITLTSNILQNKIVLAEDELALREKTIVSGGVPASALANKRRAILVPDPAINVEPADGWNNYDTYITNNLSLPDDVLQKKIHGEVAISFDVQSDGALTNVKIEKSLCGDCDEAALRVIKEGPRWKVKKGSRATAKVKVKF